MGVEGVTLAAVLASLLGAAAVNAMVVACNCTLVETEAAAAVLALLVTA